MLQHSHSCQRQPNYQTTPRNSTRRLPSYCHNGKWLFGQKCFECQANVLSLCCKCSNLKALSNVNQLNPHSNFKIQPQINVISKPKHKSNKQKERDNERKSKYEFRKFCARQLPFSNLGSKAFASVVNLNNSLKQEINALKTKHNFSYNKTQSNDHLIKLTKDLTKAELTIENQAQELSSLNLIQDQIQEIKIKLQDLTKAELTIENQAQEIYSLKLNEEKAIVNSIKLHDSEKQLVILQSVINKMNVDFQNMCAIEELHEITTYVDHLKQNINQYCNELNRKQTEIDKLMQENYALHTQNLNYPQNHESQNTYYRR